MFLPFHKETIMQKRFIRDEVQFNLFYRIVEGECAVALQSEDGGVVALQNAGRMLWLWADPEFDNVTDDARMDELAETLHGSALPGVAASPEVAKMFVAHYCRINGCGCKLTTRLTPYSCPVVTVPVGVPGEMIKAGEEHVEIVAKYRAGFSTDIFGESEPWESLLPVADALIKSGNLFLWNAAGKTVSMAAVAHRSARHARINSVYTASEERNRGYAAALVAAVSQMVLEEGLVPMLYADAKNPASNKAYRNIGYIATSEVDEYSFQ